MSPSSSDLSLAACLERHRLSRDGVSLVLLETVGSTNRLARRIADTYLGAERPPPRLVLLAREQTDGRGRRGRSWSSPAGQGLYTSLLLPLAGAEAQAALPLRVPLELCRLLADEDVDCGIKWPNDLVVEGRKLGGVLIESLARARAVVVGYGINGNQVESDLPAPGATSLRLAAGGPVDLPRLAVDLAREMLGRLEDPVAMPEVVAEYRRWSVHRPGDLMTVRVGEERLSGRFAGFDERGRLRLEGPGGQRTLSSAEMLERVTEGGRGAGVARVGRAEMGRA